MYAHCRCFRVFLRRTITKENFKMSEENKAFRRLPESIKPVLYDLYLKPDLQKFTFDGKETVTINVSKNLLYFKLYNTEVCVYFIIINLVFHEKFNCQ